MNDRDQRHQRAESTEDRPLTKAEKRAIAKERKARALAARRRRQAVLGALAGMAVVGVIVAAFVLFGPSDDAADTPGAAGSPTPEATPGLPTDAPPTAFPPTPAGADPVLGQRPKATPGGGTLTKLRVSPVVEGNGPPLAAGQTVTVNYVGAKYGTGEEFDASWNRSEPFTFVVGTGSVIPGWDQGLVGVKVGSRVQLDIPANLAYGDNPTGGQPGGPLRFIVDVLSAQ